MVRAPETQDNLWIAAGDGQLDRVKELIGSGVNVNSHDEYGYTAMHAAVSYNQKEILEYLLEKGGNVNIEDFEKDTPLYVAETVDMARFLIDRGANAEHKNEDDVSPAQNAHQEGWQEVAEFLAGITQESLPSLDDQIEESLGPNPLAEDADDTVAEHYIEELVRRIQEQGGVQDEEELREAVTKMVLEQLQNSLQPPP
ncbi:ankyrin repeat-containing domain protein [Fennellomyces sp. T-0311]|nr:ankyrin repeat-containing domain protein [Fennellomyces sp. T-0311]